MEGHVVENEMNINSGEKYDDDILNQSYEDIYSINEKKNAINKLDDDHDNVYQEYGKSSTILPVLNKNGEKIGIAKYNATESITRNCLNYAFLASFRERTPQILGKRNGSNKWGSPLELEVQSFFQHDGENNYFLPNTGDSCSYVPYKNNIYYQNYKESMIEDRTKEVTIGIKNNKASNYRSYLYMYHILSKCDTEFKTEFIDHFATLFADELCFDIQDRNKGNILVIPSKNEDGNDIVNLDVDFGWQKEICNRFYLELYLIAKEATFCFGDELTKEKMSRLNMIFEQKQKQKEKT